MDKSCFLAGAITKSNLQNATKAKRFITCSFENRRCDSFTKLLNCSEFLFSFLFLFHKMAPHGTVSHEIFHAVEEKANNVDSTLIQNEYK